MMMHSDSSPNVPRWLGAAAFRNSALQFFALPAAYGAVKFFAVFGTRSNLKPRISSWLFDFSWGAGASQLHGNALRVQVCV